MKITIENYESMSPEEKIAALEANFIEVAQVKTARDKAASEAADFKKQLRERMSEDEAKAAEAAARYEAAMAELDALRTEKQISNYTNSYLTIGYDEKLAKSTAEALAKGDMETVFKNQKIHSENREKAIRSEMLKNTPSPAGGNNNTSKTKEEFSKMTLAEKARFAQEHPDEYNEFYGGN